MNPKEKHSIAPLDLTDKKILTLLQNEAKLTIKEVAQALNLSTTPTFERIKRLERNGIIKKYIAIINEKKVGKKLLTMCRVSLKTHNRQNIQEFENAIIQFPEVIECHHIAGASDYSLKILTTDMAAYHHFISTDLASMSSIGNIQSSFVLHTLKENTPIDLT